MNQVERDGSIPWYIWLSVAGVTSAMIGVHWDIAWHRSIGRDTFWTPAHIAIQLCGVIAGITCGYLILWTTFTHSQLRVASVNVLGFRGPLGAFICAWGGFTMITSAPFDDWWHNAYGLDVKILSPPHVVLAIGMVAVEIGALVLIAARMNRAAGKSRRSLEWLFLYVASMILVALLVLVLEFTHRIFLHTAIAYRSICILTPIVLAIASRTTGLRWAATIVTAIYTVFLLGLLWILPLFPAQPKLGPVLHEVTQFIPSGFPLLVLIPAFVLDLVWPRMARWQKWQQAVVTGALFLVVLVAVEWPFGDFLQSPAARNALFGSIYYDYNQSPQGYAATYRFVPFETASEFRSGMAIALGCSIVSMWLGMSAGDWLKRVRR
ncbi:MAG: hypothetical protein ABSG41_03615 [Bryobacteraceae bacterium]